MAGSQKQQPDTHDLHDFARYVEDAAGGLRRALLEALAAIDLLGGAPGADDDDVIRRGRHEVMVGIRDAADLDSAAADMAAKLMKVDGAA